MFSKMCKCFNKKKKDPFPDPEIIGGYDFYNKLVRKMFGL